MCYFVFYACVVAFAAIIWVGRFMPSSGDGLVVSVPITMFCFALSYVHYKRWLPVQIRHLPALHATHLNVYAALLKCNPFSLSSHGTLQLSSISAGSAFLESFVPPINSGFSSTVPIVVIDWSAIVKIRKANYRWYFWWICYDDFVP